MPSAVITGGSRGIGAAMVRRFAEAGDRVVFTYRQSERAAAELAAQTGATIEFSDDPMTAVAGANVIYTDVWVSMGEPDEVWQERIEQLTPFRVTSEVMAAAGEQCRFMHCLPSFHDVQTTIGKEIYDRYGIDCMEVADDVFESPASIVFDEAENRMHTIKAVMAATL